jgi:hypothetical protein
MAEATKPLPDDVDGLKSLVVELQSTVGHQSQFIDQLLEQIKLARHQQFGTSSERFSLRQLQLMFNEAEAAASSDEAESDDDSAEATDDDESITVAPHQRAKGGRRPLPAQLPRVEIVRELDEAACQCEQRGVGIHQ